MSKTGDWIIGLMESGELNLDEGGCSSFDWATGQDDWNKVLGASLLLVYEVVTQQNGLGTVMLREAHSHAVTIAIDSLVGKVEPALDYAYFVMGFNNEHIKDAPSGKAPAEIKDHSPIPF